MPSIWPPRTTTTLYRADPAAGVAGGNSSVINSFTYTSRPSGVTVTGSRFRCVSTTVAQVQVSNTGSFGARLAWTGGATANYSTGLDIVGTTASSTYQSVRYGIGGTGAGTPVTIDTYSNFFTSSASIGSSSITTGLWAVTHITTLVFAATQAGIVLTPAFGVARVNGMGTMYADYTGWEFSVEVLA